MAGRLQSKLAVVTGAGQGIGRSIATIFAGEGAFVVVATRSPEHGLEAVRLIGDAGGRAEFVPIEMADQKAVADLIAQVMAKHGRLDIVVHNAAAFSRVPIETMTEADLDTVLAVNVKACFTLTRVAVPHMRRQGGGRILFTSSVTGARVAMPYTAHYGASKAAINGFIRTAALELARDNITVNGVEPGYIDTPATQRMGAERRALMASYIPAKRFGHPDDVAHAMLYLASDEAGYVTGQTIVVDGGSTLPESPALT